MKIIRFSSDNLTLTGEDYKKTVQKDIDLNKSLNPSMTNDDIKSLVEAKYSNLRKTEKDTLKAILSSALKNSKDIADIVAISELAQKINESKDSISLENKEFEDYVKKGLEQCDVQVKQPFWINLVHLFRQIKNPEEVKDRKKQ
jgi:hypothetical protein